MTRPEETFLQQPVRSLQTMLRVIAEDDRSLPTVIPDGIYGPDTMHAVSAFQRKYQLPVTGVADQSSWEQIAAIYEEALIRIGPAEPIEIVMDPGQIFRSGDSSPYIYLLQSMLAQLSVDNPSIVRPDHTGILDESTAQALIAFQLLAGLPPEGTLDKITWKNLVHQFTSNAQYHASPPRPRT